MVLVLMLNTHEGCLKGLWTGGSGPLLHKGRAVTVMPSCSGGGNIVMA
jgi:hypothetical protein